MCCIFSWLDFECQRRVSALIHVEKQEGDLTLPDRNHLTLPPPENKNRQILIGCGRENLATKKWCSSCQYQVSNSRVLALPFS